MGLAIGQSLCGFSPCPRRICRTMLKCQTSARHSSVCYTLGGDSCASAAVSFLAFYFVCSVRARTHPSSCTCVSIFFPIVLMFHSPQLLLNSTLMKLDHISKLVQEKLIAPVSMRRDVFHWTTRPRRMNMSTYTS